jgi:hypothetical protein
MTTVSTPNLLHFVIWGNVGYAVPLLNGTQIIATIIHPLLFVDCTCIFELSGCHGTKHAIIRTEYPVVPEVTLDRNLCSKSGLVRYPTAKGENQLVYNHLLTTGMTVDRRPLLTVIFMLSNALHHSLLHHRRVGHSIVRTRSPDPNI